MKNLLLGREVEALRIFNIENNKFSILTIHNDFYIEKSFYELEDEVKFNFAVSPNGKHLAIFNENSRL